MDTARDALPDDLTILKEALATERAKAFEITAELAVARATASEDSALIAQQKLRIAKLDEMDLEILKAATSMGYARGFSWSGPYGRGHILCCSTICRH